jgi:hypothetical protein
MDIWLEWTRDEGFDGGIWWDGPEALAPSADPNATEPPDGGPVPGTGEATLQVLEPPASQGLLDTIVGDVVASFLGK